MKETGPQRPKRLPPRWNRGGSADPPPERQPELPCNLKKAMPCCGGKGYTVGIKSGSPFAVASLCTCVSGCPACFGRARQMDGNDSRPCLVPPPNVVVNLLNAARLPARYVDASLDKFSNFSGNGKATLAEVERWRRGFKPTGERGLILEGKPGVGKTYLIAALAKSFCERGLSVCFKEFFLLIGELKAGFSDNKSDSEQLKPLIDCDVLMIDELGKGRNTDFELVVLDQLISARYNQGKTIVATTNYLLRGRGYDPNIALDQPAPGGGFGAFASDHFIALEQRVGARIFSRLREMTHFKELNGDDMRRKLP